MRNFFKSRRSPQWYLRFSPFTFATRNLSTNCNRGECAIIVFCLKIGHCCEVNICDHPRISKLVLFSCQDVKNLLRRSKILGVRCGVCGLQPETCRTTPFPMNETLAKSEGGETEPTVKHRKTLFRGVDLFLWTKTTELVSFTG